MSHHATTPLTAIELRAAVLTAKRQEDAVLAIYRARGFALSPSDVWSIGIGHGRKWLLTSVRRSISNLSAGEGAPLVQTDQLKPGPYGAREHLWERAAA